MCTANCSLRGCGANRCPLENGETCNPKIVRSRAILYIMQVAQSLTLREITAIMFYVDLSFSRYKQTPFFSHRWSIRLQEDNITFIPANLTEIFPIRHLSTIRVAYDTSRDVTGSGEVRYQFDRHRAEVLGECSAMEDCHDFLKCVVSDFFIDVQDAIDIIHRHGFGELTQRLMLNLSKGSDELVIHVDGEEKDLTKKHAHDVYYTMRSADKDTAQLVVNVPHVVYVLMGGLSASYRSKVM